MELYNSLSSDLQPLVLQKLADDNKNTNSYSITFDEHLKPSLHVYAWALWCNGEQELSDIFTLMENFKLKTLTLHCENDDYPILDYIVEEIMSILDMQANQIVLVYSLI